ncbi:DMT family transporter [Paracoccus aminophilus]|uniref:Permeases of the drug/metabolite transporter (DMT) superfamily n=1 Tax=Paracoccus aminophilus JCM 7686 TaxID=1367847 RepID=S5XYL8_PARAH|nr:EamA family transporter [Paracoccus aminophilus]AGT10397.1 permeases of the drug/metabolite transporter (DMT) superfamily [Paracoccus aminophilus JCM 7686]
MKTTLSLWVGIPVFNTLAQVFVKLAAEHSVQIEATGWAWVAQAAAQPWMLAAAVVEIACFFLWMHVLAEVDLGRAFPLTAVSYVLIVLSSWFWFLEPASALQIIGSALILGGVYLIGTASEDEAPEPERQS